MEICCECGSPSAVVSADVYENMDWPLCAVCAAQWRYRDFRLTPLPLDAAIAPASDGSEPPAAQVKPGR